MDGFFHLLVLSVKPAYYFIFLISFRTKSTVKLVLLDEADAMTKDAQFALRRGLFLECPL